MNADACNLKVNVNFAQSKNRVKLDRKTRLLIR
jgi:hypothetical protein